MATRIFTTSFERLLRWPRKTTATRRRRSCALSVAQAVTRERCSATSIRTPGIRPTFPRRQRPPHPPLVAVAWASSRSGDSCSRSRSFFHPTIPRRERELWRFSMTAAGNVSHESRFPNTSGCVQGLLRNGRKRKRKQPGVPVVGSRRGRSQPRVARPKKAREFVLRPTRAHSPVGFILVGRLRQLH